MNTRPPCRSCGHPSLEPVLDLGMQPPCESFLTVAQSRAPEVFHPLTVVWCPACTLLQLDVTVDPREIFDDYAYFSSYSTSWVDHARRHVEGITDRFGLGPDSLVVEIASNDGYLLQHVVKAGIRAVGIEPARTVAEAAEEAGIPTIRRFFDERSAGEILDSIGSPADVVIANNVLAQVPYLRSFLAGLPIVLAPMGAVTIEVPHVLRMLEEVQFDTIYHEHYSYFSLRAISLAMERVGMSVFDVEELPTHGGSIRVYAQHRSADASRPPGQAVEEMLRRETEAGLDTIAPYRAFAEAVPRIKRDLLEYLIAKRRAGQTVVGYGAPGKANTLLNYCGIRSDLIDFLVDRNPYKHGRLTPGTHIPIRPPEAIDEVRPDVIIILPWNLVDEIAEQLEHTRQWGCELVTTIPTVRTI